MIPPFLRHMYVSAVAIHRLVSREDRLGPWRTSISSDYNAVIIPAIGSYDLDSLSNSLTNGDYCTIFLSFQAQMLHSLASEIRERALVHVHEPDPTILWFIMMMVFSQVRIHEFPRVVLCHTNSFYW